LRGGSVVHRIISASLSFYHYSAMANAHDTGYKLLFEAFGKLALGESVEVLPEAPVGGRYTATVKVIDRVHDAASGTFGVRLEMANPGLKLPAGIKCKASFAGIGGRVGAPPPGAARPERKPAPAAVGKPM
jgi:hypothetical protein